jgi:hypothetical protein
LAAEFLVIVVGVLVALAVDRGVREVDRREAERALIEALREDFARNREVAEEKHRGDRRMERLGRDVLAALLNPNEADLSPRLFVAAELSGWQKTIGYQRSAWEDLTSVTGAAGLSDAPTRRALAEFYSVVESTHRYEAEWLTYILAYRDEVRSYLPPEFRIAVVESFVAWDEEVPVDELPPLVGARRILVEMAQSRSVTEILGDVIQVRRASADEYREHLALIDAILQRIDDRDDTG